MTLAPPSYLTKNIYLLEDKNLILKWYFFYTKQNVSSKNMLSSEGEVQYKDSISSCRLPELFARVIHTHQISFADWYELMTAPLDGSFTQEDEDLLTRLIYAVRQGWVKIVDEI
jgi:hypothetical protein